MFSSRRLDNAERWMRAGIEACRVPAYFESIEVNMTVSRAVMEAARARGIHLTYVHILVRAAALALAANPDLHQMVCGGRIYSPEQVDIALSVAGDSAVAPILVIRSAVGKLLPEIADEVIRRAPEVRETDRRLMQQLRRWGWIVPTDMLRRALLRALFRSYGFRKKGAGTFQVSVLSSIDLGISPVFSSSAMLVAGGVRDKVIALSGSPVVQPMVTLTCCADHRVWDGRAGQRFLLAIRQILESGSLAPEVDSRPVTSVVAC